MESYTWLFLVFIALVLLWYGSVSQRRLVQKFQRKRRKGKMPTELLKEFIGKVCSIMMFGGAFGMTGKIVAIEGNWIKFEQKKEVQLINGDMIQNITMLPEKYQK